MNEPEGRVNHQNGALVFLATHWRAFIGANRTAADLFGHALGLLRR